MNEAGDPTAAPSTQSDVVAWIREHWGLVAAALAALVVLWLASGEPHRENGRYTLIKDDVPCESSSDATTRRWCYIVLDTRTGELEERVRKLGGR